MPASIGRVNSTEVYLHEGDICKVDAEALVNAANNHLWMGAGVAGALKRAGGAQIEREAVAKGPIQIGEAVATTAGELPAKRVIHAAVMGQDLRTGADIIHRATVASLRVATNEGLGSIALPAFGTGVGGFSKQEAARQMVGAVFDFLGGRATTIRRVIFSVYDEESREAFSVEIERHMESGAR